MTVRSGRFRSGAGTAPRGYFFPWALTALAEEQQQRISLGGSSWWWVRGCRFGGVPRLGFRERKRLHFLPGAGGRIAEGQSP